MADDAKTAQTPEPAPAPAPPAVEAPKRDVTDNPGEGPHMFTDWALI
jgi:hypothetical protein